MIIFKNVNVSFLELQVMQKYNMQLWDFENNFKHFVNYAFLYWDLVPVAGFVMPSLYNPNSGFSYNDDDDDKLFLWYGWPTAGIWLYF